MYSENFHLGNNADEVYLKTNYECNIKRFWIEEWRKCYSSGKSDNIIKSNDTLFI